MSKNILRRFTVKQLRELSAEHGLPTHAPSGIVFTRSELIDRLAVAVGGKPVCAQQSGKSNAEEEDDVTIEPIDIPPTVLIDASTCVNEEELVTRSSSTIPVTEIARPGGVSRTATEPPAASHALASVPELTSQLVQLAGIPADRIKAFLASPSGWRVSADSRAFLNELVREEILTPWQRTRLLTGPPSGLQIDRFVLLDQVNEGAFGTVIKAKDHLTSTVVALKIIRSGEENRDQVLKRFDREVAANARLDHSNLLRSYDVVQAHDSVVLVLEYINGADLFELVRSTGPLPIAVACDCVHQAAQGLAHAHARGVVHRDIKPNNILLSPRQDGATATSWGAIKIVDMGLVHLVDESHSSLISGAATAAEDIAMTGMPIEPMGLDVDSTASPTTAPLTSVGMLLGTVEYMAPEQALDAHHVDHRADLYALGATFFFLLTGQAPFSSRGSLQKMLYRLVEETPRRVRALRPECPAELDDFIASLLAKAPDDRPQSAKRVSEFLKTVDCSGL